ncbi:multicopper oxidase family protein [Agrilutibacter solisilvae]|uniref:Multicopper oxidase CueO n=1 Tax=Agrilutibacter solisilvae TaxID=2763317 RepID=A0A975ASS9_9GAMM|nr:multicopper oxidase domain-containing protein [Lysobacter solisilvae]QSX79087.1 multicopper oxidase domain-containing protein [Lysobacter solisilvae]
MVDSRRRQLLGLSLAAAALGAAPFAWRALRRGHHHAPNSAPTPAPGASTAGPDALFQQPLRIPGREGLMADVHLRGPLALQSRVDGFNVFPGQPTPLWHYAGQWEGHAIANPVLHVAHGQTLQVSLDNRLQEATTVHWHGLVVDEANDGSGLHPVEAGMQRAYRIRVANRAGLYWYHAHPHQRTGLQVHAGLAGLLLVEDDEELALRKRLGLQWGDRDLPLLIADKQVDTANRLVYRSGADDWIGNRVLVNWTPEPFLEVVPGLYRLRLANVCNARVLRPAFLHEEQALEFHLIGTDGGLLAQPWPMEDLFLAPAQRADVLVDFSRLPPGARVVLRSLDYVPMENEDESGAFAPDPMGDHPAAEPMGAGLDLMQFCVAGCGDDVRGNGGRGAAGASGSRRAAAIPASLSSLPAPPDTRGWPVRPFRLHMDSQGAWFINGHNFHRDGHAPAFTVKRGTREVWELRNAMTSMPHPIHVHGVQFRVVERRISPQDVRSRQVAEGGLGPQDLGCNDTVLVWPGETVRIAIDFDQPFDGNQQYMLHCHNLEHEDMGMMLTFAVTD